MEGVHNTGYYAVRTYSLRIKIIIFLGFKIYPRKLDVLTLGTRLDPYQLEILVCIPPYIPFN